MKLKVNAVTSNEYQEGTTILTLLSHHKIENVPWLVVSVNGIFIPKNQFGTHVLNDGDVIELVYVQGGG